MQTEGSKNQPVKQFGDFLQQRLEQERTPAKAPVVAGVNVSPKNAPAAKAEPEFIAFLKALDPVGRHNLWSKNPKTGEIDGKTFEPGDWPAITKWVEARVDSRNLYYTLNEPHPGAPANKKSNGKPSKSDIAALRAVCVDLDPDGEVDYASERHRLAEQVTALRAGFLPPTFAIDSGGGFQLVWLLENKINPTDEMKATVEAQSYGIADILDGDTRVAEIATLLRLPGTQNIPDAGKIARGRFRRRTSLIEQTDRAYSLHEIGRHYEPRVGSRQATDSDEEIAAAIDSVDMQYVHGAAEYSDLEVELREKFEAAVEADPELAELWHYGAKLRKDGTASTRRFNLAGRLHRRGGFTINEYGALLWVWDPEISVKAGDDPAIVIDCFPSAPMAQI